MEVQGRLHMYDRLTVCIIGEFINGASYRLLRHAR